MKRNEQINKTIKIQIYWIVCMLLMMVTPARAKMKYNDGLLTSNSKGTYYIVENRLVALHTGPSAKNDTYQGYIPEKAALRVYNNVINPLNTENPAIYCDLSESGKLSLKIYDSRGYTVTTIAEEIYSAGSHSFQWNGRDQSGSLVKAGLYFIFMTANGIREYKKLAVIRN